MDATPRFDTGGNHMGAWWGIHPPHESIPEINQYRWKIVHPIDDGLMQENLKLKKTVDELHKRNHELIENQSKIEQKSRTKQRQYDAKVYAYWKQKAEKLQEELKHTSQSLFDRCTELRVAREFLNRKVNKENTNWAEKYQQLVWALQPLSEALSNALEGNIYKSLSIEYNESSESNSKQCSATDSLSC